MSGAPVLLRPRGPADDAFLLEMRNRQEADSMLLGAEYFQGELAAETGGEVWVAEASGEPIGWASLAPAWWTGRPDHYSVEIRVADSWARRGVATCLWQHLRSRLGERGAARVLGWVRPDPGSGAAFVRRLGFQETGQAIEEARLHLPSAPVSPPAEAAPRDRNLRIRTLAELQPVGEPFLRDLQAAWADSGSSAPESALTPEALAAWTRQVLEGPGLSPGTHWVALDGKRPIGLSFLRRVSPVAAENDYTGVLAPYRRRGVASALKWRAVAWAREHGLEWLHTSTELGNTPMRALNERMGYRPGIQRVEVGLDLG